MDRKPVFLLLHVCVEACFSPGGLSEGSSDPPDSSSGLCLNTPDAGAGGAANRVSAPPPGRSAMLSTHLAAPPDLVIHAGLRQLGDVMNYLQEI